LEKVQTFLVEPFERKPDEEAHSRLVRRSGGYTGTIVPGVDLEAELEHGGEHLLFLTHDIPYEEQLEILLIDRADKLVDRVWLGGAYTTGNFRDLIALPGPAAEFDFFGEVRWRVTIFDRPRLSIPFLGHPVGVHREFGFNRRLAVERL
jgi:hypothetical protein